MRFLNVNIRCSILFQFLTLHCELYSKELINKKIMTWFLDSGLQNKQLIIGYE